MGIKKNSTKSNVRTLIPVDWGEGRVCQKTWITLLSLLSATNRKISKKQAAVQINLQHLKIMVMNLIKIIKTNVMPILGLAIAAGLSTWSLTSANTTKYAAPMDWYEKQPDGSYQLLSGGPTDEPSNGCQEAITDLCAKGFAPGTAPSEINDSTPAVDRYHVEP